MYWLAAVLVFAIVLGVILTLRRRQAAKEKAYLDALGAIPRKPVWGKHVTIPNQGPVCQAVKSIADTDFKVA